MNYLRLFLFGASFALIYLTFEPVANEVNYFPIYEAIWAGLGLGTALVLVCALLCGAGLYAYLWRTKPRVQFDDAKEVV
jgi:hypothetical protein